MQLGVMFGSTALGGPLGTLGMLGASAALNYLVSPKRESNAAKPNDLKVSSSVYGRGIGIVHGTMRVTGNMFWATDIVEERRFVGDKGKEKSAQKWEKGKAEEVLEYYGNFCMGLCEGTMDEVIRIWADSNLIYDKYDSSLARTPGWTTAEAEPGKKGGPANKKGRNADSGRWPYRFYGGTEYQDRDPMLVKYHGAETSAHRGLCYMAFERFPLADFGNRIPTITAEVVPMRQASVSYTMLQTLEDQAIPNDLSGAARAPYGDYLDPIEQRLLSYRVETVDGIAVNICRVWNLATRKEEYRWKTPTRNIAPVGFTARGHVAIFNAIGGLFTGPIVSYDVKSGVEIFNYKGNYTFGNVSKQRGGQVESFTLPSHSLPIYPDGVTVYFGFTNGDMLAVIGDGSDLATLNRGAPGDNAIEGMLSAGLTFRGTQNKNNNLTYGYRHVAQGYPTSNHFFYVDQRSRIFKCTLTGTLIPLGDPDDTVTITNFPDNLSGKPIIPPGETLGAGGANIQQIYVPPTTNTFVKPPVWSIGAGIYVVVETTRPSFSGLYDLNVIGMDEHGTIKWKSYIGQISGGTDSFAQSSTDHSSQPIIVGSRYSFIPQPGQLVTVDLTDGSFEMKQLNADVPRIKGNQYFLDRSGAILMYADPPDGPEGWCLVYVERFAQQATTVASIIADVCTRSGIDASLVNTVGLKNQPVTGHIIENPTSGRSVIEALMQGFMFDACESDGTLKFVSRGNAARRMVTQKELGLLSEDDAGEVFKESRMQEINLPQTAAVTFIDAENDYLSGTAHYRRPRSPFSSMQSQDKIDVNLPIALTPDTAKQMAESICLATWSERATFDLTLPWSFIIYDPTDVLEFQMDDGLTLTLRMMQMDLGADLTLQTQAVEQTASRYTQVTGLPVEIYPVIATDPLTGWVIDTNTGALLDPVSGDLIDPISGSVVDPYVAPDYPNYSLEVIHDPYSPVSTGVSAGGVVKIPRTGVPKVNPIILDVPFTEDDDSYDAPGANPIYYGVAAVSAMASAASIQVKVTPREYSTLGSTVVDMVHGKALDVLPAPADGLFVTDTTSSIRLLPQYDFSVNSLYEWESETEAEWPSFRNMVMIGLEIVLFRDVQIDPVTGIVTISHLIRGHRGTEQEVGYHVANETFVVLNTEGQRLGSLPGLPLATTVQAKALTGNVLQSLTPEMAFYYRANALRPYAVNDIRRADAAGDSTITWQRRTRIEGTLKAGTGTVPLNEDTEQYRLYILDSEPDLVTFDPYVEAGYLRAINCTSASAVYTAAMKTADGLTSTETFWVMIYQMSASVGFGFPRKAQLNDPATSAYVVT